jgi:hypothetical protein
VATPRRLCPQDGQFGWTLIAGSIPREAPKFFLEEYQWADLCLPQLVAEAVRLTERFDDPAYFTTACLELGAYVVSGRP